MRAVCLQRLRLLQQEFSPRTKGVISKRSNFPEARRILHALCIIFHRSNNYERPSAGLHAHKAAVGSLFVLPSGRPQCINAHRESARRTCNAFAFCLTFMYAGSQRSFSLSGQSSVSFSRPQVSLRPHCGEKLRRRHDVCIRIRPLTRCKHSAKYSTSFTPGILLL